MDSNIFKKAALIAAACTTGQAIIWFALSLVGLLTTQGVIQNPGYYELSKPSEAFPYILVRCFFSDYNDSCCRNLLTRGSGMLAITIVYMCMSLAWLCVSTMLIVDLVKEKKRVSILTKAWAGTTITICVLDFVVAVLFGTDYAYMDKRMETILVEAKYVCGATHLEVAGFLMSLAARGYVLWILNLVVAIWLLRSTAVSMRPSSSERPSEGSDYYRDPQDALKQDSPSVFPKRPWMDKEKLAASQTPSNAASDDPPADGGPRSHPATPVYAQINRKIPPQSPSQGPMSPSSASSPRQLQRPPQNPGGHSAPQYARSAVPPRSVLKKPPPPPSSLPPTPGTPISPNSNGSWHQPMQQPNNNWQQGAGDNVRRPQSYDNRSYDRGY